MSGRVVASKLLRQKYSGCAAMNQAKAGGGTVFEGCSAVVTSLAGLLRLLISASWPACNAMRSSPAGERSRERIEGVLGVIKNGW